LIALAVLAGTRQLWRNFRTDEPKVFGMILFKGSFNEFVTMLASETRFERVAYENYPVVFRKSNVILDQKGCSLGNRSHQVRNLFRYVRVRQRVTFVSGGESKWVVNVHVLLSNHSCLWKILKHNHHYDL
jgi:hypothetical protein